MDVIVWCVVGALLALVSIAVRPVTGLASRVESLSVGIFGAVIGGEWPIASAATGFRPASLALAFGGGVLLLVLLAIMRRAVGPLKPGAPRKKSRY